jgi:U2 small nuclear ribonucleoprotein B''
LSNLPDKLQKADLKRELYMLFSTYGTVLDIVAQKTAKMRGQAHIVYKDVQTAAHAMRQLEGFVFFGKPMVRASWPLTSCSWLQRIAYAKSKSDFISKLDGTFKIPVPETEKGDSENASGDKGTALQQSIFSGAPAPKPNQTAAGQGLKRGRDEDDDDTPVDEDEDEDEELEMDESDDD